MGNVLLNFDRKRQAGMFASACGRDARLLLEAFMAADLEARVDTGEASPRDIYGFFTANGFGGTYAEFLTLWNSCFTEITPMKELFLSLKGRLPVYILSNTNLLHFTALRKQFPFLERADGLILSYEEKCRKPQPRIYEIALRRAGVSGGEAVFIDDLPANIEAARQAGINALLFTSHAELLPRLSALSVCH